MTDLNQNISSDDLIQLLSQMQGLGLGGGNIPGKTDQNKLNYYQDIISTLGFDPIQAVGSVDPEAPVQQDYQSPVNKQRFIYNSDPVYKSVLDNIDKGQSPASAVKNAGIKDPTQATEAQKVAVDYAASLADDLNNRQKFEQSNQKAQAKYTAPDGSKYKNAPLGGSSADIMGSASEFDLLGQPTVESLMAQLAGQDKRLAPQTVFPDTGPRTGAPMHFEGGAVHGAMGAGRGEHVGRGVQPRQAQQLTVNGGNGGERSWEAPATSHQYVGGTADANAGYQQALRARINQAKNTQVNSDAKNNALKRILTAAAIFGH